MNTNTWNNYTEKQIFASKRRIKATKKHQIIQVVNYLPLVHLQKTSPGLMENPETFIK